MLKLIWKDSLHFDRSAFFTSYNILIIFYINLFINFGSRSAHHIILGMFYIIVIILFTFFPIKLAKGLYLCPLTEEDRKKYIITACYMRFGILMLIYGIVLLVSRFLLEASNLILFLQYVCGGIIILILALLCIHPGSNSMDNAMELYYSVRKIPLHIKPKIKKLNKKIANYSMLLLIIAVILATVGVLLIIDKKEFNPYLWFYYIPAFIVTFNCLLIYYRKYLNEIITFNANQEIYHYLKKKAGVFRAD